ncbi:MAG: hypothetical protein F6J87_06030 [Spirulina sp. SIO3F2]|nr:hypothetical protein [Spirulina sp. SIO3F2]
MTNQIFVPSKQRPGETALLSQLKSSSLDWVYVVEPQEEEMYRSYTDRVLVLPENEQGIAYVRQWILDYCRAQNISWYWMLDDDISRFYKAVRGKNLAVSITEALEGAEKLISKHCDLIGQAALEYQQFAWSAKKSIRWNSYCDVCVLINSAVIARYRKEVELKEDRDFTLQIQSSGLLTATVTRYSFAAPANGSNPGGLQAVYQTKGKERASIRKMCELWPGVCTPQTKSGGRYDIKINWKVFRP